MGRENKGEEKSRLERKNERRKEGMTEKPRASQAVTNQTDMRCNERKKKGKRPQGKHRYRETG